MHFQADSALVEATEREIDQALAVRDRIEELIKSFELDSYDAKRLRAYVSSAISQEILSWNRRLLLPHEQV